MSGESCRTSTISVARACLNGQAYLHNNKNMKGE